MPQDSRDHPAGRPSRRALPPAGPPPGEAELHQAALAHLARFAATEIGLRRVLERRADRWARRAEAEGRARDEIAPAVAAARHAAAEVARRLAAAGTVQDAAFAEARARRLARGGRSRRAIAAHLAAKGVGAADVQATLPEDPEAELDAALAHCRRRRIGPFGPPEADHTARLKALAALARAGFVQEVARRALDFDQAEAEERLLARRQG